MKRFTMQKKGFTDADIGQGETLDEAIRNSLETGAYPDRKTIDEMMSRLGKKGFVVGERIVVEDYRDLRRKAYLPYGVLLEAIAEDDQEAIKAYQKHNAEVKERYPAPKE